MRTGETIKEIITKYTQNKRGLLATNYYNLETLHGILRAASDANEPIILQLTQSSLEYMGLKPAYELGRASLEHFGVQGWIHLDHGGSYTLAEACLKIGFDSVMIDGSELPFTENVELTKKVVAMAKNYGAHVEAELGYVAKLGQKQNGEGFTRPSEAKQFVEETGVDALAIAVGSAHGFYDKLPDLKHGLIAEIAAVTPASLVLHGSSGIPENQVQEAISHGICKINLATEIKDAFTGGLKDALTNNREIDLRKIFPIATDKVTQLVSKKLEMVKNLRSVA